MLNRARTLGCVGALVCFAGSALAQTCAVKNHMRLVNRINNDPTPELRIDTGWQSIAAGTSLDTPGSSTANGPLGFSTGSWLASSSYGSLAFSGSGSGHNVPGNGIFLWIDEWIGAEPKAQFRDRLTVVSASLPANTPVTIRAVASVSGYATCSAPPGQAEESFGAVFGGPAGLNMTFTNSSAQQTQDFIVPVGQFRDFFGRLHCTIRDNRILGGTVYSDTIEAQLYATLSLTVLTPGASLQFCSTALYAPCKADFNGDGLVDDSDFTFFVSAYNILDCADPAMPAGCPADLNSDGLVDDADFVVFLAGYNTLLCP
ncbi:MAG: hypothetical protein ACREJD_16495 [Phycisphaerales bacterium]